MNRRTWLLGAGAAVLGSGVLAARALAAPAGLLSLPGERERWLNSPPLGSAELADRPVLLEFWTYGCYNCRNTLPWVKRVYARYAPRVLAVIAVHTPEFAVEREPANVRDAIGRLGVTYPVLLDPDGGYWKALGNRYWPAFYLYGRDHDLVERRDGELHEGESGADSLERAIALHVRA